MLLLNVGETLEEYTRSRSEGALINALLDLPETAQLVGTLRTVSEDTRARMKQRIEAICAGVGQAFGVQVKVTFTQGIPCVYNAPAFTESVMECVEELTGRPVGDMEVPLTGSDDWR